MLIVRAGDARMDNARYKAFFQTEARMLPPQEVLRLVRYPVSGVCPFALNPGVKVYLDQTLRRFQTVFQA